MDCSIRVYINLFSVAKFLVRYLITLRAGAKPHLIAGKGYSITSALFCYLVYGKSMHIY